MAAGFDPGRAVEMIAPRYGSGYRIGGRLVLTAAHLLPSEVGASCDVRLRLDAGAAVATGIVAWLPEEWKGGHGAPDSDVAVVALADGAAAAEPATLGRLPEDPRILQLPFDLFGWPEWGQTRRDGRALAGGRHVDGVIYLADTSGEGLLVLEPARRPDADPARSQSPWQGISGAAVVSGGCVVAVQRQHQNPRRSGSLEAVSLARFADDGELQAVLTSAGIDLSWPTVRPRSSGLSELLKYAAEPEKGVREIHLHLGDRGDGELLPPPAWAEDVKAHRAFGVPLYPTQYFAGRATALAELSDALALLSPPRILVIAGTAGVGKTQLAVEYAYAQRADYDVIWWVRADRATTLLSDFAGLAAEGRIAVEADVRPDQSSEQQAHAVRGWLERHDGWLLVFDNADSFDDLRTLLPRGGGGKIVITSRRDTDWAPIAQVLSLDVLDPESASALLLERSGDANKDAADDLVRELGSLPLAIEQAAGFISQTAGFGLADYLTRFRRQSKDLLDRGQAFGYEGTINTTWNVSLGQLLPTAPTAVDLLELFAFLDPEDIPAALVFDQLHALSEADGGGPLDTLELAEAASALRAYGFVKLAAQGLFVHRLLQTVVRNGLDPEDEAEWAATALGVITAAFARSSESGEPWDSQRLLPHALAVIGHAERLGVEGQTVSVLLDHLGLHLRARGEYAQAIPLLERAVALDEELRAPDDPDLVTSHGNLGVVLHASGDLPRARAELERASTLAERLHGPDHADLVLPLSNLGAVLQSMGELPRARATLERSITLGEEIHGPDDPRLVLPRSNLGAVLQALGELPRAREELEAAIAHSERLHGPDHPETVLPRSNLGAVLMVMGELPRARAELVRAIAVAERTHGPDHPDLVPPRSNLGMVLQTTGDLPGARAELERAIALAERIHGPDHPNLVQANANLGITLQGLGDLPGARAKLERAVTLAEQLHGPTHPDLVLSNSNLGALLYAMEDLPGARARLERANTLAEQLHWPNRIEVSVILERLGRVERQLGDLAGARDCFRRALASKEASLGPDAQWVGYALFELGRVENDLGDAAAAHEHLQRALSIEETSVGRDAQSVGYTVYELGRAERGLGNLGEARDHLRRALAIEEVAASRHNASVSYTLQGVLVALGSVSAELGDLDTAKTSFEWALAASGATDAEEEPAPSILKELRPVLARIETTAAKAPVAEHDERELLFDLRRRVLTGEDVRGMLEPRLHRIIEGIVAPYLPESASGRPDVDGLIARLAELHPTRRLLVDEADAHRDDRTALSQRIAQELLSDWDEREAELDADVMRELERLILIRAIDRSSATRQRDLDEEPLSRTWEAFLQLLFTLVVEIEDP